ncbi:MAG: HAD hydrolase family protein [Deltaproteobacteria bacterium]|nr:HAD hydrolase family protein [Deltaproteobacteria bacterium]MBW1816484.1 HAD hydrolase family protein [Deltaproteobacteria bacterium]MBW2284074.1 HAD hydrolase family protein [Deltaproteobacteria bacterium]
MKSNPAPSVTLLFLDVDGVMTDGCITLDEDGREMKAFNVKDGLGLKLLMSAGIEVVIVTGRTSGAVSRRAEELGIREVYQGVGEKGRFCRQFREKRGLSVESIACLGDDLPDLEMFRESGVPMAVADAVEEVRQAAVYVTRCKGGAGAVREACEYLLKARGKWPL